MKSIALSNDLTTTVDVSGSDELAEMAEVFKQMLTNFRSLIVEVNHSVNTLNTATVILAKTSIMQMRASKLKCSKRTLLPPQ